MSKEWSGPPCQQASTTGKKIIYVYTARNNSILFPKNIYSEAKMKIRIRTKDPACQKPVVLV